jgi:hypothetical protein
MMKRLFLCLWVLSISLGLGACQTIKEELILSKKSALELRSVQSRRFPTDDKAKVYRSVISMMQDLGYALTSVEPEGGVVSGNKLAQLRLTATVTPKGTDEVTVRANASVRTDLRVKTYHQVDSAEFYQQRFFEPLSQALFLDALYDEEAGPPAELVNNSKDAPKGKKE